MEEQERVQHLRWLLERQLAWISSADAKAAGLVAFYVALAAIAATILEGSAMALAEKWLFALAGLCAVPGVISALVVFMPQTTAPHDSWTYFGGISSRDVGDFRHWTATFSGSDLIQDLGNQIHVNSAIATSKHLAARVSALFGAITLLLWLVAVAVAAIYPPGGSA